MKHKLKEIEQKITQMPKKYHNFGLYVTLFGGIQIIIAILSALFIIYLFSYEGIYFKVIITSVFIMALNTLLKFYFAKKRPKSEYAKRFKTYSFPSGHSSGSMIVYLNLAYLLTEIGILNVFVNFLISITTILMIGWSRIYLKAHYLTDVLAGYTVGLIGFLFSLVFVY